MENAISGVGFDHSGVGFDHYGKTGDVGEEMVSLAILQSGISEKVARGLMDWAKQQLQNINALNDAASAVGKLSSMFAPDAKPDEKLQDASGYKAQGAQLLREAQDALHKAGVREYLGPETTKGQLEQLLNDLKAKVSAGNAMNQIDMLKVNRSFQDNQAAISRAATLLKAIFELKKQIGNQST
jgi:hypothetical protein